MRATSRLDVWVIPENTGFVPSKVDVQSFSNELERRGFTSQDSGEGPSATTGGFFDGFAHLRIVHEPEIRFVANQQGGFRVYCGTRIISGPFSAAMTKWRLGGERGFICQECSEWHALESLNFRPDAGFYRFALHFSNVNAFAMTGDALDMCADLMGSVKMVLRRIG